MDDLDRLLASDDAMVPSARFTADVMERIASEPTEPVVFPWGRFAAGVLACMAWAACGVWILESGGRLLLADPLATLASVRTELEYAVVTIVATLVAVRLPMGRSDS